MSAFWSGNAKILLEETDAAIVGSLAQAQMRHFRTSEVQQLRSWEVSLAILRTALVAVEDTASWWVLVEYPLLRLGRRADIILLTPSAVLVLEFKIGATRHEAAAREQVEDYALDLWDFHAGCRGVPIVPILVATDSTPRHAQRPLALQAVWAVLDADAQSLPDLLRAVGRWLQGFSVRIDPQAWIEAPYRPVPTIVEAACMLYARHGVAEIAAARADTHNLTRTTHAILQAIASARASATRVILFVTGIPAPAKPCSA